MNTAVCKNGQFTFFLVLRFDFIIVMYCGLFIVILVPYFSSVKIGMDCQSTPNTLHQIKYGSVKVVVIVIVFYP